MSHVISIPIGSHHQKLFFFSSRRRHTRFDCDWSSDVCSSDLLLIILLVLAMAKPFLESLGALPVLAGRRTHRVLVLDGSLSMAYAPSDVTRFEQRSEERRVGKEGRSRGSPYH